MLPSVTRSVRKSMRPTVANLSEAHCALVGVKVGVSAADAGADWARATGAIARAVASAAASTARRRPRAAEPRSNVQRILIPSPGPVARPRPRRLTAAFVVAAGTFESLAERPYSRMKRSECGRWRGIVPQAELDYPLLVEGAAWTRPRNSC